MDKMVGSFIVILGLSMLVKANLFSILLPIIVIFMGLRLLNRKSDCRNLKEWEVEK